MLLLALALAFADEEPDAGHPDTTHHGPDHNQIRGLRLDIHVNLDQYAMIGTGGRMEFANVPQGFLHKSGISDELALSFGADVMFAPFVPGYYNNGLYVVPIGAVQWNIYLPHNWSVFPELGVAAHIGIRQEEWHGQHWIHPWPNVGFGFRFHFTNRVALLFRVSTPGGLQFGLNF